MRLTALATPHPVERAGRTVGGWAAELADTAASVAAAGRSVIVAVPDRRDLEQLAAVLAAGPAAGVVLRIDAALPAAERYRAHLAALGPGPHVLIGARSAVYAPAPDLGAILVWDEADAFHQEPLAPYAATRDVALLRQEQSGAGLLLLAHTRSTTVQRLVQVGWLTDRPAPRPRPEVVLTPDDDRPSRIPSAAWRALRQALTAGPVLVQVARPGEAALKALATGDAPPPIDAGRTAHELGRAFPGVPVLIADGEHVHDEIDRSPRIVVSTRGAEPRAPGGYRAVLLLDGRRMLARESLWVAEDCLRWWAGAAALAAPDAPVHLVGVSGDVATALATWRFPEFAARQLADRRDAPLPARRAARDRHRPGGPGAGPRRGARGGGRGGAAARRRPDRAAGRAPLRLRGRSPPRRHREGGAREGRLGPPPEAARPAAPLAPGALRPPRAPLTRLTPRRVGFDGARMSTSAGHLRFGMTKGAISSC